MSARMRSPTPMLNALVRKRARVEDEPEMGYTLQFGNGQYSAAQEQLKSGSAEIVRDDTYYMEDGSCVLQVENTLFNVSTSPRNIN